MLAKLAFALILAGASATPAPEPVPKPGSYGFNWLDPDSECKQLTAQDLASVLQCETSDNAFGLELQSRTCKVSDKVEWVVYDTAEHCQQALETMQANGD